MEKKAQEKAQEALCEECNGTGMVREYIPGAGVCEAGCPVCGGTGREAPGGP